VKLGPRGWLFVSFRCHVPVQEFASAGHGIVCVAKISKRALPIDVDLITDSLVHPIRSLRLAQVIGNAGILRFALG
jgi:hypothetical protein